MKIFREVKGIPEPEENEKSENGTSHQEGRIVMKENMNSEQCEASAEEDSTATEKESAVSDETEPVISTPDNEE